MDTNYKGVIIMHNKIFRTAIIILGICLCSAISLQSSAEEKTVAEKAKGLRAEHVFDARVYIGSRTTIGKSKYGERGVIPITGGTFEGPNIKGEVLPGGEDWQLKRYDGDGELYARYMLKTDDGFVIQVINRVLIHMGTEGGVTSNYIRSVLDFEAPSGSPYEWLNHAIFVGTLGGGQELKQGEKPCVVVSVYKLL
jgi:hypothetical protein